MVGMGSMKQEPLRAMAPLISVEGLVSGLLPASNYAEPGEQRREREEEPWTSWALRRGG